MGGFALREFLVSFFRKNGPYAQTFVIGPYSIKGCFFMHPIKFFSASHDRLPETLIRNRSSGKKFPELIYCIPENKIRFNGGEFD